MPDTLGVSPERFIDLVQRVPAITGHSWDDIQQMTPRELLALERLIAFDITQIQTHLERTQGEPMRDPSWRGRANRAKLCKQQQVAALRQLRRMHAESRKQFRNGNDSVSPESAGLARKTLHLARMVHQWLGIVDDDAASDAAWQEVVEAYERIPPDALIFRRHEPLLGEEPS